MPSLAKGLLVDLWGTLLYPSVSMDEYHRLRVESLSSVLDLQPDRVMEAYTQARRFADLVRSWTMREVDVVGEVVLMLEVLGVKPDEELIEELVEAYMRPYVSTLRPADGAAELLERARELGYVIVLASNTLSSRHTVEVLRRTGLHRYFDFFALSDSIGFRKPHPKFFSYAILGAGISPSQSIFVGDEELDIAGARPFGFTTVAYTGFHEYKGSVQPHFMARSFSEVADILEDR